MGRHLDYARFDEDTLDHPKIRRLLRDPRGGSPAFVAWFRLVCWARKHANPERLDEAGILHREDADEECRDPRFVDAMIDSGLLGVLLDGRLVIHDFIDHQDLIGWATRQRKARNAIRARWDTQRDTRSKTTGNAPGNTITHSNPLQPKEREEHSLLLPAGFEDFYDAYPRHAGRAKAIEAYAKALMRASAGDILAGARRYAEDCERNRREAQYIAHPSTWLNQDRWDDEYDLTNERPGGREY